jgi:hypothetical protein
MNSQSATSTRITNPTPKEFADNYPYFRTHCAYQVFDDVKKESWSGARVVGMRQYIPYDWIVKRLLYENKKWKWIFFSYNPMTNPSVRGNIHVMKVVTRVAEIDAKHGQEKKQQLLHINKLWQPPSCVVESKNGYHCYRFADDTATKENRHRICQNITAHIGWDPNAPKLWWVFRIPGFCHNKDPANPFLVKCVYIDPSVIYSEQQMLSWFKDTKKNCYTEFDKRVKKDLFVAYRKRVNLTTSQKWDTLYKHLSQLDNRDMLYLFSWTWLVRNEHFSFKQNTDWTEQIIVDGNPTSCWIDRSWNIWSSDWGWPTRIQWVLWYRTCSYQELVSYIKQYYPSLLPINTYNATDS